MVRGVNPLLPLEGPTRILVCGSRDFDDWRLLNQTLSKYGKRVITIIEGGAGGADFLSKVWAKFYNQPFEEYKADWDKYGKSAGYIRNQQMLDEGKPDLVIAFPVGKSVGTHDMIRRSINAGLEVIVKETK